MSINLENENDINNTNVFCRFRPMTKKELEFSSEQISPMIPTTTLNINTSKEKNIFSFDFDKIFPPNSTQQEIYENCAKKSVENFLMGYNNVIITHGQSDSGKNYTMTWKIDDGNLKGIIPRAVKDVFEFIFDNENLDFIVKVSMIDIYQDKIKDLINNNSDINILKDDEFNKDEIIFDGIYEKYVSNENEILNLLEQGINNKARLDYSINLDGKFSKSNFIFILKLIQINKKEDFFLKSELIFFNSSGEDNLFPVSNSYEKEKGPIHIFLKKIFGGNYQTNLIITCCSSIYYQETTLKFLRFGEKMKKIKNKAKINKELSYIKLKEKLRNYEIKIKQLEKLNSFKNDKNNIILNSNENLTFNETFEKIMESLSKENNIQMKEDILGKIYNLKDKYNSDIANLNNKIKDLEEKIKLNNDIKFKLQKSLIIQQTQNMQNNNIFNDFMEFISELKKSKEININKIEDIEFKFKNFENKENLDLDININTSNKNNINSFNDLILEKNIQFSYENENNFNKSEKFSQTEINQRKSSKNGIDAEKDIKYLSLCLEENKDIILELKKEIITLQSKNKILENNALLNERKIRDKNMILENNILELKKKYEESQVKRLILEDKCRKLNNIFLNKKLNLINIKEESINKSISTPKNIIQISTKNEEDKL